MLWRDGWAQWRDTEEIVPEAFVSVAGAASTASPPEPTARFEHEFVTPGGMTSKASAPQASPSYSKERPDPDTYLGAKKRRKSLQRTKLIGILAGIAIVLVVALVVALAWPR